MKLTVTYKRSPGGMIRWTAWKEKTLTEMEAQLAKANGHLPLEQIGTGHSSTVKKARLAAGKFADRWAQKLGLRRTS